MYIVTEFACPSCNVSFDFKSKYMRHLKSSNHKWRGALEVIDMHMTVEDETGIDSGGAGPSGEQQEETPIGGYMVNNVSQDEENKFIIINPFLYSNVIYFWQCIAW